MALVLSVAVVVVVAVAVVVGILIGRKNKKLVEAVVADVKDPKDAAKKLL